jgi:class 3 adenylate cyclase
MLVEFPSVVEAVSCAVAVQRGMLERNANVPEKQRIVFRVGINLGDVIVEPATQNYHRVCRRTGDVVRRPDARRRLSRGA